MRGARLGLTNGTSQDMFDKNDEALDIVLGHAILNLNPSVVCAYLKEGVLLR